MNTMCQKQCGYAVAALAMVSIPFAPGIVRAQSSPPEPAYTYEVVSVKPSQPGQMKTFFRGYRTQNATAMDLLTFVLRAAFSILLTFAAVHERFTVIAPC